MIKLKKISKIIKNKYQNNIFCVKNLEKSKKKARKQFNSLDNTPFTIISTNCIAGEIYNLLGLRFDSPTINCSFVRKDFVEFCLHMDYYLNVTPQITGHIDNSPILCLKGNNKYRTINIHFPHDTVDSIVLANWEKRKKRIHKDRIFIICDDRGLDVEDFYKLNEAVCYKKIIFTSKKTGIDNTFFVKKYKHRKMVGKYNVKSFKGTYVFQDFFDYVDWITKGC